MRVMNLCGIGLLLWFTAGSLPAAQLDPKSWKSADLDGNSLALLTDNNLETQVTLKRMELDDKLPGLVIDLGEALVIHRVYWCGDANYRGQDIPFPVDMWKGVTTRVAILVGDSPDNLRQLPGEYPIAMDSLYKTKGKSAKTVDLASLSNISDSFSDAKEHVDAEGPDSDPGGAVVDSEGDFRFPPLTARYVKLEARGLPAGASWILGEVEIYGFQAEGQEAARREAVMLPADAPEPLSLAARDLSYYLGEMLGRPVPVIAPGAAESYSGPIFRIADLKSLAGSYDEMKENVKTGKLPSCPVNVEAEGKEVVFRAWPYKNVLASVWAFLESQGVRWTYPDPHGDFVPSRNELDMKVLPLHYSPAADRIYANFSVDEFRPTLTWELAKGKQFPTEGYLYFWRNHWSASWNGFCFGGGQEVPPPRGPKDALQAAKAVKDEYKEGFDGYPHSFSSVVPRRILEAHPDWMGVKRDGPDAAGKRNLDVTPCFTNEGLIDFVANKAAAWAALYPDTQARFGLLPMDAAFDCECEKCLALNQPLVKPDIPYVANPTYYRSDAYYHFVCEVARKCQAGSPNASFLALAYANVFAPPRKIAEFPGNVVVEVCSYGRMNLSPDSPRNAKMKSYLEEWATKCKRLETYGYVLLNEDAKAWPMPLPLVTATVNWAKLQRKLGALPGGTQASPEMIPYCPWNFYAYPRGRWQADTDADALLKEFFDCHFREAGREMLSYYKAAEDYQISGDVSLYGGGYTYRLTPEAFSFPVLQEMSGHLKKAESAAVGWVVKRRLASMRKGFDWLVAATGLTSEALESPDRLPPLGPGLPPLTVSLAKANILPGPRGGDNWLAGDRRIGHLVCFAAAGKYLVTFKATGYERKGNSKREMVAYVGASSFGRVDAPDGAREYAITVEAPEGVHEIGIRCPQQAGPMFISDFTISPLAAADTEK